MIIIQFDIKQDLLKTELMLENTPKHKYFFFVLLILELIILVCSIITGQFLAGIFMVVLRLMLLLAGYCCESSSWAALYSVFALIAGLFSLDPVGLFVTGRKKN